MGIINMPTVRAIATANGLIVAEIELTEVVTAARTAVRTAAVTAVLTAVVTVVGSGAGEAATLRCSRTWLLRCTTVILTVREDP